MDEIEGNSAKGSPERMQTTVFVSYSREDQARALPIIQLIEAAGFATWWDGLLEGGERFSRTTEDALNRAKAVVVLWSKAAVQSHWVHDEATRGRDRRVLVPLSLDGSHPPLGFGQFQVINLATAKITAEDPAVQSLLRSVAALHEKTVALPAAKTARSALMSRRGAMVGGLSLAAGGGGFLLWNSGLFSGSVARNSVAVLPFDNLSGDPEQRYFSDGLASEIRSNLSRNALLEIVGQTSSNQFRDHDGDARSIARELQVSFLLDGNVQKMGNRLKIVTDLIDGGTGISKWAQTFERQLSDVFAVQSEIATAVAGALSIAMDSNSAAKTSAQVGGTKSLAAFDAFLRGRDLFEAHVDESSERAALAMLDQSIALDNKYAAARALRSRSLAIIANQFATTGGTQSAV